MEPGHGNQRIHDIIPQVQRPTAQGFGVAIPLYGAYFVSSSASNPGSRDKPLNYLLSRHVPRLAVPLLTSSTDAEPQSVLWRTVYRCFDLHFHRDSVERQNVRPSHALVLGRHQMGCF